MRALEASSILVRNIHPAVRRPVVTLTPLLIPSEHRLHEGRSLALLTHHHSSGTEAALVHAAVLRSKGGARMGVLPLQMQSSISPVCTTKNHWLKESEKATVPSGDPLPTALEHQ